MLRSTPPALAEAMLTEAIDLRAAQSDPASLPGLLLQRARARRANGNLDGARADIERGIAELEENRESIPEGETRWGAFNGAEELFEEGVDLALANNDAAGALRFAEQARVRALLDTYGRRPNLDYRELPPGTIAVEYVALPARLVIFTVDASRVRVQSVAYARETLVKDVAALTGALSGNESTEVKVRDEAAVMYRRLIAPVAEQLAGKSLVFVPDGATATVPFGALTDSAGVRLLQRHSITVSGSVAAYVAASQTRREEETPREALLMSAAEASEDLGSLRQVRAETRDIAAAYSSETRVHHGTEWPDMVRRAPDADIIHFAGHAVGDDRGLEPASIVIRQDGRTRRVRVAEIAKLQLRRSPIVVLAGCNTARGQQRAAEGVISVAHGFLSAGAPSVIATLWPIDDDDAARFFPRLHRHLARGLSSAEALRAAQLESIQQGDVPASLWAAIENFGS